MKKVFALAIIVVCSTLIFSCEKGYTCLCSDENGDPSEQVDMEKTMEAECAAKVGEGFNSSCKLVSRRSLPNRP